MSSVSSVRDLPHCLAPSIWPSYARITEVSSVSAVRDLPHCMAPCIWP